MSGSLHAYDGGSADGLDHVVIGVLGDDVETLGQGRSRDPQIIDVRSPALFRQAHAQQTCIEGAAVLGGDEGRWCPAVPAGRSRCPEFVGGVSCQVLPSPSARSETDVLLLVVFSACYR